MALFIPSIAVPSVRVYCRRSSRCRGVVAVCLLLLLPSVASTWAFAFFSNEQLSSRHFKHATAALFEPFASAPDQKQRHHHASSILRTAPLFERQGAVSDEGSSVDASSTSSSKPLLLATAGTLLSLISVAAATSHLPGPIIDATSHPSPTALFWTGLPFGAPFAGCSPYSSKLIIRDVGATLFSIVAASAFVKCCTYPVTRGWLEPRDSRKIVHTLSAPLFILVWPLFSPALGARVFASVVALVFAMRLFLAGNSTTEKADGGATAMKGSESELAMAISRSGDAGEALQGPLIYTIVLFFSIMISWTDSPIGVMALSAMAFGDGLADLVGRRLGKGNKWFFSDSKSMAGSAAFALGTFTGSYGLLSWLTYAGAMDPLTTTNLVAKLAIIAVVCAAVELLPLVDDNYSVPISAAVLAGFLLN